MRRTVNNKCNMLAVLAVGIILGWISAGVLSTPNLHADERRKNPPVAFKSGGERSAEILEKISKQITTLDERLARIETAVAGKNGKK